MGLLPLSPAHSQSPEAMGAREQQSPSPTTKAPAGQTADPQTGSSKLLGKDLPSYDPGQDVMTWDGKIWNVQDQRIFRARFEKYLNAEEESGEAAKSYRNSFREMMLLLAPGQVNEANFRKAWKLLPEAANYGSDGRLCDSLDDAIFSVILSKRASSNIELQNQSLKQRKSTLEWNSRFAVEDSGLGNRPLSAATAEQWNKEQNLKRDMRVQPMLTELAEVNASIAGNRLKREAMQLQAKIEFQVLIAQLFLQRRFEHVLLANRFYRHLFGDGDNQLRVSDDYASNQSSKNKESFGDLSKLPKTLSQLDALASEAMRDVREGVESFLYILEKNELKSASERLGEAFAVGEYLPEIRLLPREKKRQVLDFTRNANQLLAALEVKDYDRGAQLVKALNAMAKDFDDSKPLAAIETARTVSAMHLAKAKTAAASGDRATLEAELRAATEIWPRNPALAEVSSAIFTQTDLQQQALSDFDRLYAQKNLRQIFDDKVRFIAATAMYPERQEKLKGVLDRVQSAEAALMRASELAKRGDPAGAWESVEHGFSDYPDDPKLNQVRADLTTQAAGFVKSIRTAQEMEKKRQLGSSLAWYLRAQQEYPNSEIAKDGVNRISDQILKEL
ncbi:MAG: hypothetical protein EBV83_00470 [Verrucomicrobia bacterium]|nr:hypothetical protein [Verrucomicrobiota bacterium]